MFTFTSTTEIFHCLECWCWTGTWLEGNVHFHTHQQIWNVHCHLTEEHSTTLMWEREQEFERMDHYSWQNRLLLKPDSFLVIKTIVYTCISVKHIHEIGDTVQQQGNYSLRRPPKLIINKNIHWPKMGYLQSTHIHVSSNNCQKRHQFAPRFGTCMYDPYTSIYTIIQ